MEADKRLPGLADLMTVGMSLPLAVSFWRAMMETPDRNRIDWWAEMRMAASPSGGHWLH